MIKAKNVLFLLLIAPWASRGEFKEMARPSALGMSSKENFKSNQKFCTKGGGQAWTPKLAGQFIQECSPDPIEIVKRRNRQEPWSLSCAPSRYEVGAKDWLACPPLPYCKEAKAAVIRKNDAVKLGKAQIACGKPPSGRGKAGDVLPDDQLPKCSPELPANSIDTLVIHHSAGSQNQTAPVIQNMHKQERGWSDMGYHYLIGKDSSGSWKIFEGRAVHPKVAQGAHVGTGLNEKSLGIMIAGRYTQEGLAPGDSSPAPPPEALALLSGLVKKLKAEFPIKNLESHGSLKDQGGYCEHKNCPGEGCSHVVQALKDRYFSTENGPKKQRRKL